MPTTTSMHPLEQPRWHVKSPLRFRGTAPASFRWSFPASCHFRQYTSSFTTSLPRCGDIRSTPYLEFFSSPSFCFWLSHPSSVWHCFTSNWPGRTTDGGGAHLSMLEWRVCSSTLTPSSITSTEVEWVGCSKPLSTLVTCQLFHLGSSSCWEVQVSTLVFCLWSTSIQESNVIKRMWWFIRVHFQGVTGSKLWTTSDLYEIEKREFVWIDQNS